MEIHGSVKNHHFSGLLAQPGERYPCKVEVMGSSPIRSTSSVIVAELADAIERW